MPRWRGSPQFVQKKLKTLDIMKIYSDAGEFFNSPDYRIQQQFDVRRHAGFVVVLMDNGPAVVTQSQWEKACATQLAWDSEGQPDEELDEIWNGLMTKDLAHTPRGKKAIAATRAEYAE